MWLSMFLSNTKFRIFIETYLKKLHESMNEIYFAEIAEATEVNIKFYNVYMSSLNL